MEFKAFPKIERMGKQNMQITQKIHGTNAQIFIVEWAQRPDTPAVIEVNGKFYELHCGSRTRWIYPGDDNYGFAAFVHAHKEEFIEKLGPGQHFGEWAGPGINSGEGLTEKTFVLFDYWKFPPERPLPPNTRVVPVLYEGPADLQMIEKVMTELKASGSRLVPGFTRPEGIVIQMNGTRFKKVFEAEETQWKKGDPTYKSSKDAASDAQAALLQQYMHLLQPIRLEKLLSRDERYVREFPKSLPQIVNDYFADLVAEGQVVGTPSEINGVRKLIGSELFKFCRTIAGQAA